MKYSKYWKNSSFFPFQIPHNYLSTDPANEFEYFLNPVFCMLVLSQDVVQFGEICAADHLSYYGEAEKH